MAPVIRFKDFLRSYELDHTPWGFSYDCVVWYGCMDGDRKDIYTGRRSGRRYGGMGINVCFRTMFDYFRYRIFARSRNRKLRRDERKSAAKSEISVTKKLAGWIDNSEQAYLRREYEVWCYENGVDPEAVIPVSIRPSDSDISFTGACTQDGKYMICVDNTGKYRAVKANQKREGVNHS